MLHREYNLKVFIDLDLGGRNL